MSKGRILKDYKVLNWKNRYNFPFALISSQCNNKNSISGKKKTKNYPTQCIKKYWQQPQHWTQYNIEKTHKCAKQIKNLATIMELTLREISHFSTMFSTTYQPSFIVENIIFNCKMFFATQKWCFQLLSKIVENVELTLQHNWKQCTCVNLWVNVEVTTF